MFPIRFTDAASEEPEALAAPVPSQTQSEARRPRLALPLAVCISDGGLDSGPWFPSLCLRGLVLLMSKFHF